VPDYAIEGEEVEATAATATASGASSARESVVLVSVAAFHKLPTPPDSPVPMLTATCCTHCENEFN